MRALPPPLGLFSPESKRETATQLGRPLSFFTFERPVCFPCLSGSEEEASSAREEEPEPVVSATSRSRKNSYRTLEPFKEPTVGQELPPSEEEEDEQERQRVQQEQQEQQQKEQEQEQQREEPTPPRASVETAQQQRARDRVQRAAFLPID